MSQPINAQEGAKQFETKGMELSFNAMEINRTEAGSNITTSLLK